MLLALGIILLLVLANGLFVAAEFAIVGAPRTAIEHLANQGNRLARHVTRVLDDPRRLDHYIATTQIGISVASLGLGMYGELVLAEWIAAWLEPYENPWLAVHATASVLAVAFLTYIHIVIGEMVPKTIALQHADQVVLYVSPIVRTIELSLLPLVAGLNAIGNGLLGLLGVRRQEVHTERYHSTEKLQFIIQESQEGGFLRGEAGKILRELFEFGDLTAGEVMVPRVQLVGVPVGTGPDALRAIVRAHGFTRYPVFSGDLDNIVGTLHIKSVLRHLVTGAPITARDARPLPFVPGQAPVDEVLAAMRRSRSHMAVVMDQHGGTAGIVTMEDLFEETVGDIEEGRTRAPIAPDGDGSFRVRGTVRLNEVGEVLGRNLDHPKVTAVSGLVLLLLGRPPAVGDAVTYNGVRFEVTAVAGRGVRDTIVRVEES